jgi:filamentous hemagglutinin family protein
MPNLRRQLDDQDQDFDDSTIVKGKTTGTWQLKKAFTQSLRLGIGLIGISSAITCLKGDRLLAQLRPIADTAPERNLQTIVSPLNPRIDQITGGTRPGNGANVFHSFAEFNIDTGRGAYFENPANVTNIISRVTGNNVSQILGTLGVGIPGARGAANLFLINPNGIIFGQGARLNVGGSFVATTANALQFPDGNIFSASAPNNPAPTLTVNPSAFFYNQIANQQARRIEVQNGANLFVGFAGVQANLLLVGGDVLINGGKLQGASGSQIQIGGFTGTGSVGLIVNNTRLSLNTPITEVTGANISLNNAVINLGTRSKDAGNIFLLGSNISLTGDTKLSTSTFGSGKAGLIFLFAENKVSLDNSALFSTAEAGSSGNSGGILIEAGTVSLNTSKLDTTNNGSGIAGAMIIRGYDQVALVNSEVVSKSINTNTNAFGVINLEAKQGSVSLRNSSISTTNFGSGYAGDITISASDQVSITEKSSIFSRGNFGRILIGKSDDLNSITDYTAFYPIFSPKVVTIDQANLNTDNSSFQGAGAIDAGAITIRANEKISITNASEITSSTFREGDAGAVLVEVKQGSVFLDNSRVFSTVEGGGFGDGGNILVEANSLVLNNGAQLQTLVRGIPNNNNQPAGQGDAGAVTVIVGDSVKINGRNQEGFPSAIFSTIEAGSIGTGGDIDITAKSLYLNNGGLVSVDNRGLGEAGDITITLREDLLMQNGSNIKATTFSGQGGDVDITARDLFVLTRNSDITTQAGSFPGGGDGGNIRINTQYLFGVPTDNNNIIAQAFNGNGGNIYITASKLYKIDERSDDFLTTNDITASSKGGGVDGLVRNNVLNTDPTQGLTNLPVDAVDPSRLIAQRCAVRSRTSPNQENKFTVTQRGGLPPNPNEMLQNESVVTNWVTLDSAEAKPSANAPKTPLSKSTQYIEAQGWVINEQGEVILTAQAPTATPYNPTLTPVFSCNGS